MAADAQTLASMTFTPDRNTYNYPTIWRLEGEDVNILPPELKLKCTKDDLKKIEN